MSYNLENKITFEELAPSLQNMIHNTISQESFDTQYNLLQNIKKQISDNRISITSNLNSIPNPSTNKELAINIIDGVLYTYDGVEWVPTYAVYA